MIPEVNKRKGRATITLFRFINKVWISNKLTEPPPKSRPAKPVFSARSFMADNDELRLWPSSPAKVEHHHNSNEFSVLPSRQEKRLSSLNSRSLGRMLRISRNDRVTNTQIFKRAGIPRTYTVPEYRQLGWLGNVFGMDGERIPKDIPYGELVGGKQLVSQAASVVLLILRMHACATSGR